MVKGKRKGLGGGGFVFGDMEPGIFLGGGAGVVALEGLGRANNSFKTN